MHTKEGKLVNFCHNGDYSGNVIVMSKQGDDMFQVPFEDLKMLVACYVRDGKIAVLEQAEDDEILGLRRTLGTPLASV